MNSKTDPAPWKNSTELRLHAGLLPDAELSEDLLDDIGRARLVVVAVVIGLTIRDQTKNKIIFDNQNYVFRGEYEVTGDPQSYFNEEAPATDRLARDFARSVMTTVMEGF